MTRCLSLAVAVLVASGLLVAEQGTSSYAPTRINKAIELLERNQPIYYTQVNSGGYAEGKQLSNTWLSLIHI